MFGSVTTSVTSTGVVTDGAALCYLSAEDVAKVHEGDAASLGGEHVTVARVSPIPHSRDEARDLLQSDYLVSALAKGDWAYLVTFDGDVSELAQNVPLTVSITVERIAPITLILGGNA